MLGGDATLSEVFCPIATDGAAIGFVLAVLDMHKHAREKPLLWVQDRLSRRETGRPYLAGMTRPMQVIAVDVSRPIDVLWAMEEGLRCPALAGVIGEVWGDPPALDFTATKRLAMRAETHGVPAFLIRRAAHPNLSAARLRWNISSLPSRAYPHDQRAPGAPMWRADLFRARWQTPGDWVAHHDGEKLVLDHGVEASAHDQHRARA